MNMGKKHLLVMILCCLIPLVGLAAISLFKIPVNGSTYFLLMLLCPVAHIVLMKYMMSGHEHGSSHHESSLPASSRHEHSHTGASEVGPKGHVSSLRQADASQPPAGND